MELFIIQYYEEGKFLYSFLMILEAEPLTFLGVILVPVNPLTMTLYLS